MELLDVVEPPGFSTAKYLGIKLIKKYDGRFPTGTVLERYYLGGGGGGGGVHISSYIQVLYLGRTETYEYTLTPN